MGVRRLFCFLVFLLFFLIRLSDIRADPEVRDCVPLLLGLCNFISAPVQPCVLYRCDSSLYFVQILHMVIQDRRLYGTVLGTGSRLLRPRVLRTLMEFFRKIRRVWFPRLELLLPV